MGQAYHHFLRLFFVGLKSLGRPLFYVCFYLLIGLTSLLIILFTFCFRFLHLLNAYIKKTIVNIVNQFVQYLTFVVTLFQSLPQKLSRLFFHRLHQKTKTYKKIPHVLRFPLKLHQLTPLFLTLFLVLLTGSFLYFYIFKDLPHPKNLITVKPALTTKIYDRHQTLLYKVFSNQNRTLIDLKDLPVYVIQATLAIEDAEFYNHVGFSVKGMLRALQKNLLTHTTQGGSTITQQLVKSALLSPEKTLQRKLKELVLALLVENYFTKDEILNLYLNEVGYGGPTYGIEEAAQYYFGKSATHLTLAEASVLAGLPVSPTIYSPFGSNPELAISRQHEVLRRMVEENFITSDTADTARGEKLNFIAPVNNIKAPHFVMYVKDVLAREYNDSLVNAGGLDVVTSLDYDIQMLAETVVKTELASLKKLNITNAAVLITNPRTGEILAMVGSGDYFDIASDGQVNVTLRPRQPGSSIKPLMYSLALEKGFTAATIINDSPITYNLVGSPPYTPKNYDNRFHGHVTLAQALANSYNVPAVKTLSQLGVTNFINYATKLGITTWTDPSRYGLSLTLGGGEVKMIDLAVAYGSLANYGRRVELHPILKVTDISQATLEAFTCSPPSLAQLIKPVSAADSNPTCLGESVLDAGNAYILTKILSDNQARSSAFGTNSVLNLPGFKVAVKTGTTNNLRDNWTIGYTPDYLVAVWVGNNDNTPMSYVASGITGASPIWSRIMTSLLKNTQNTLFIEPDNIIEVKICGLTGTLACNACPNNRNEVFLRGTEPQKACTDDIINRILNPTQNPTPGARDQILDGVYNQIPLNRHPTKNPKPER